MAIDTADKRASAFGWPGIVYPTPDGSLALVADRVHVAGLYRGTLTVATPIDIQGRVSVAERYALDVRERYALAVSEMYRLDVQERA